MPAFMAGCGSHPLDDFGIRVVELREAPKLEFLRAHVGMRFFEVRFEFENRSEEPVTVTALDFSLRDTQGDLYALSAQVLDMGQPKAVAHAEVEPESVVSGSVVFQIPASAMPAQLIYRREVEGGLVVKLASAG